MRNHPGKGDRFSRYKVMDLIANPEGDLPVEKDDLLVLALVDMQGQMAALGFIGLPNAETSLALPGLDVNDHEGAREPKTGRARRTRLHRVTVRQAHASTVACGSAASRDWRKSAYAGNRTVEKRVPSRTPGEM